MPDEITEQFRIKVEKKYRYTSDWPKGCKGKLYKVDCFALLVPVYQNVVVVKCLNGPDAGQTIICSELNFTTRYELYEEEVPTPEPIPEKIAGTSDPKWGRA